MRSVSFDCFAAGTGFGKDPFYGEERGRSVLTTVATRPELDGKTGGRPQGRETREKWPQEALTVFWSPEVRG